MIRFPERQLALWVTLGLLFVGVPVALLVALFKWVVG